MAVIGVWAPHAGRVRAVVAGDPVELSADADGWWSGAHAPPGTDYAFLLDQDDEPLPDPASRWQPNGVHGASRVYDQAAHPWGDTDWHGRELPGAVIYELHIGTFTAGATFDTAAQRLDHLEALGITHVELLPVNSFNGVWNWGYDGVGWYAVHEAYGGPDGLKRFVDACHARGLAVVLDVVYNHLGPSGNYLPRFGPYLEPGRNTWGELVNLGEPRVRSFVIENALMWLREFHVDALRLDAVHALHDSSPTHVLTELSAAVDALSAHTGRPLTLIAESDLNDPGTITPRSAGGRGLAAQWDDDVHHALHSLLTGETHGYYCDFGTLAALAKVFTSAFFHDGTYSTFRGRPHGKRVDRSRTPGYRFVVCLQNHDQVGNRAGGDRLPEVAAPGLLRVGGTAADLALHAAAVDGRGVAASTRWPFFTSHPETRLAETTGAGRLQEFARHGWDVTQMLDPQDPATYRAAILDWSELGAPSHAVMLELYRRLIALRAAEPDLADPDLMRVAVDYDEPAAWVVVHRGAFRVVANLSEREQEIPVAASGVVLATGCAEARDGAVLLGPESAAILRTGPG